MNIQNYALRSAVFAAVYTTVAWAAAGPLALSPIMLPAVAIAALWLVAQSRFGRHRYDVIMLATATAVAATLHGAGLLLALTYAVAGTIPAVLFMMMLNRMLPGYWLGHGDRFRRRNAVTGRLAASAAVAAVAGVVLVEIIDPEAATAGWATFAAVRDTALIMLVVWAARSYRLSKEPRRGPLSVVR
ncbi:hypothetical protein AMIS_36980 [Actinoplanes missouriensis 431]|uniref:Uncharacterized protein n=1 Tax=Actinoplanes missouriensis (strain ATCC 14538 / DSM 43046 / CBS 188.64 / JCM 3121 / NBRC 102363 / NCIMB 12654 / NRRL B-3342 / UNCC 431) TaxID=512565 RepID=I0H7D1_ACTM4|nr:hypothetical protein [Actinoplanes missouriensis]BAL88918.1 hypothetical protein AMIS_36980 [Actinoplanes missouriensis 431]